MIYLDWFYHAFHGLLHICGYFFFLYVLVRIAAEIMDYRDYRHFEASSIRRFREGQIIPDAPADQVSELERLYRTEETR